jgi:hypothetical protein
LTRRDVVDRFQAQERAVLPQIDGVEGEAQAYCVRGPADRLPDAEAEHSSWFRNRTPLRRYRSVA